jgi:hypothetical protein
MCCSESSPPFARKAHQSIQFVSRVGAVYKSCQIFINVYTFYMSETRTMRWPVTRVCLRYRQAIAVAGFHPSQPIGKDEPQSRECGKDN